MITFLSDLSGLRQLSIRDQVETERNASSDKFKKKIDQIKKRTVKYLNSKEEMSVIQTLREATSETEELFKAFSESERLKPMKEQIDIINQIGKQDGQYIKNHFIKTGFTAFDREYFGIPSKQKMITICGRPSAGKSSFLTHLIPQMLLLNEDLIVRFHSTDDPRDDVILSMMCSLAAVDSTKITSCRLTDHEKQLLANARSILLKLSHEGRLEIRDCSSGYSMDYAEQWMKQVRDTHPDKKIIYVLDNMYKTWKDSDNIRSKVESASNQLHIGICQGLDITSLCTVECKKPTDQKEDRKGKPKVPRLTINDIKESGKVEFNSYATWLIHNGAPPHRPSEIPDTRIREWTDEKGIIRPIIEIEIAKIKKNQAGLWRLFFHPAESHFREESCIKGRAIGSQDHISHQLEEKTWE